MKKLKFSLLLLIFFALALTGCSGGRLTATSWAGLGASQDTAFLAFGPHVYGVNLDNGLEEWRFPAEADNSLSFYAPPSLAEDGQLIVGGYDNTLYSLNPETGLANGWAFTEASNRYVGAPLVMGENIYAPAADGKFYAVNNTGQQLWPEPFSAEEPFWTQPSSNGELLFIPSLDHHLYAINSKTGREVWSVDLEGAVTGHPLVVDDVVYIGSFSGDLFAIDARKGTIIWRVPSGNWVWAGPAALGSLVVFGNIDGRVIAVDPETGRQAWEFAAAGGIYGKPLVVGDAVYFGTDNGTFYAVTEDNQVLWTHSLMGKIYTSPISAGELILVSVLEGEPLLTAFSPEGSVKWSYNPVEN